MSVTEEEGGRLNAFAKEPKIEVIKTGSSNTNGSRQLLIVGLLLGIGLIVIRLTIS